MAAKKVTKKAEIVKQEVSHKTPKAPALSRVNAVLAALFYIIWILIGVFFLLFIYGNIRQGLLKQLFGPTQEQMQQQAAQQAPTETSLPGVGKVNIECVQSALSEEVIQKLLTDEGTSNFTAEEKEKLSPCIVEAEASPVASPQS